MTMTCNKQHDAQHSKVNFVNLNDAIDAIIVLNIIVPTRSIYHTCQLDLLCLHHLQQH